MASVARSHRFRRYFLKLADTSTGTDADSDTDRDTDIDTDMDIDDFSGKIKIGTLIMSSSEKKSGRLHVVSADVIVPF
jgi:hypothetical protein